MSDFISVAQRLPEEGQVVQVLATFPPELKLSRDHSASITGFSCIKNNDWVEAFTYTAPLKNWKVKWSDFVVTHWREVSLPSADEMLAVLLAIGKYPNFPENVPRGSKSDGQDSK